MATEVSPGVTKKVTRPGNGAPLKPNDKITVHCTGSLATSNPPKKFWSTKDAGQQPFTFNVGIGQVIKGWDEGCLSMTKGESAVLTICGEKGYGAAGFPAWGIPPNTPLQFEIEILSVNGQ